MANIGYHTRLDSNNTIKTSGGSFGGELSLETANRLVNAFFTVAIKNTGRSVFVDRYGREVSLYISVDAAATKKGQEALKVYHAERYKMQMEQEEIDNKNRDEIEALMNGLTQEEIISRLSNKHK